ncbi:hypothetical protein V6N13_006338 [Hibiscus sabdariffa]
MLRLYLCKGFNNLLEQDDKGDVSAETTGPAPAEVSAGIQISAERDYSDPIAGLIEFPFLPRPRISADVRFSADVFSAQFWGTPNGVKIIVNHRASRYLSAASPSAATDTPAEAESQGTADEDHEDPHTTTGEPSAESSHAHTYKPEEIRPPPPFPQRLKKQKHDYQFKKFFDILKQVHINLPLVEALQQMSNYAKFLKDMVTRKKRIEEFETAAATETCLALMHNKIPAKKTDPGSFTIECFIGHNYPTKALCDPGASINLMPKSVFRKLGIGEAKPTTVMLQLADHSYVQPEGKIEDILVKIDKFIFPADFLLLDCEADEKAPIILGRPFLSTSRAVIDFDNDEIIFKVDDDQVKIRSLTKQLDKGKGITESPAKDIPRTKQYIGSHVERDRATMSLREA